MRLCIYICGYSVCAGKGDGDLYRSDYRETIVLLAEKLVEETGVIATVTDPNLTARAKNKVFLLTLEDPETGPLLKALWEPAGGMPATA